VNPPVTKTDTPAPRVVAPPTSESVTSTATLAEPGDSVVFRPVYFRQQRSRNSGGAPVGGPGSAELGVRGCFAAEPCSGDSVERVGDAWQ